MSAVALDSLLKRRGLTLELVTVCPSINALPDSISGLNLVPEKSDNPRGNAFVKCLWLPGGNGDRSQSNAETGAVAPYNLTRAFIVKMGQRNGDAVTDLEFVGGLDEQPGAAEIPEHSLVDVVWGGKKDVPRVASSGLAPTVNIS